jgi:hypothetical protein
MPSSSLQSASNVGRLASNTGRAIANGASSTVGSFFASWGGLFLVVLVLVALFAVYYETIGYYIQIGWNKMGWSRKHGEKVEIDVPGGPSAILTPSAPVPSNKAEGTPIDSLGGALQKLESDVESALGSATSSKQVFNVSRNLYTFSEAEPLCRAFGAELATYDQVKDAYKAGADWCNYGWVKGQLAVYPTQKETYEKLQAGPEKDRMSCGLPGLNGGYFPNADQRFGVNCYGSRPAESAEDQRIQMEDRSSIAFDREVNRFKSELDSIGVNPWSSNHWSQ